MSAGPVTADAAAITPASLSAACDTAESTALVRAFGTVAAVEAYISRNAPRGLADIAAFRDSEGRTALHWAVALRSFDLARALLPGPYAWGVAPLMTTRPDDESGDANGTGAGSGNRNDAAAAAAAAPVEGAATTVAGGGTAAAAATASWALPGDVNGSTVLASACAVAAPPDLVRDIILAATGIAPATAPPATVPQQALLVMASSSSSSSQSAGAVADGARRTLPPPMHPFIEAADATGNTPLHIAASRGNMPLVTLLLAFGSDPRRLNKRSQTALHRLVGRAADVAALEFLVHFGRRHFPMEVKRFVNAADVNGDTALHYASMEENREAGELLLRCGADRNIKNKQGKEYWQL